MRNLVLFITLFAAGCPVAPDEVATGEPDAGPPALLVGEGSAWTWGVPACSTERRASDTDQYATIAWRDRQGRRVMSELRWRGATSRTGRRGFDAAGRLVIETRERDGKPEWIQRHHHDSAGRLASLEIDDTGDGVPDQRVRISRDAAGRVIERSTEGPGPWLPQRERWTYDDAGRPILRSQSGASGQAYQWDWSYDERGQLATAGWGFAGATEAGRMLYRYHFEGDDLVRVDGEDIGTNRFTGSTRYVRGADGQVTEEIVENAILGEVERRYAVWQDGHILEWGARTPDGRSRWNMRFDRQPGRVTATRDQDGDGTTDGVQVLLDTCPDVPELDRPSGDPFEPTFPLVHGLPTPPE